MNGYQIEKRYARKISSLRVALEYAENALARARNDYVRQQQVETQYTLEFAQVHLASLQQESGDLATASSELAASRLYDRSLEIEKTKQQVAELEQSADVLLDELEAKSDIIADKQERLEAEEKIVDERLDNDQEYQDLKYTYNEHAQIAEKATQQAEQSAEESAAKRIAYESDPLFHYLYQRGYGTDKYGSGGLIRTLDGWVAKVAGYSRARKNFSLLNKLPVFLKDKADDAELAAGNSLSALESYRTAVEAGLGVTTIEEELAHLQQEHDEAETAHHNVLADIQALNDALVRYAKGEDKEFADILAEYAQSIENLDIASLYEQAKATASDKDDQLSLAIERTRRSLDDLEQRLEARKREFNEALQSYERANDALVRFRKAGYANRRYRFSRYDERILLDYILGSISISDIERHWGSHSTYHRPRVSHRDSGFGGGLGGGFGSGGGFGGGGGFRTGGGF